MKLVTLLFTLTLPLFAFAQKTEFDLIVHVAPGGFKADKTATSLTYSKQDSATGGFCTITLTKSQASDRGSRENLKEHWKSVLQKAVKVGEPEIQPSASDNGWVAESGVGSFEIDGKKGVALLMTATGHGRVSSIVILTNTDAYATDIASFLGSVSFKKPTGSPTVTKPPVPVPGGKFQFTTTNFDDGWVGATDADWVSVTKGSLKVRVHYPNKTADAYDSVLKTQTQRAWNTLVAPRYSGIKNFQDRSIQSFESIGFAEANAVDKATGKSVYVVLFKKHRNQGDGKYIEFVTDSKATFEKQFMPYRNEEFGWEKLENFAGRNRFAVAGSDLVGTWTTRGYAGLAYYYVSSGAFAGATSTSTADEYRFVTGGKYSSDHSGASGQVGNLKFSRQTYKGSYSTNQWSVRMTNRFKGEDEVFQCHFEAVKGGRILVLRDRNETVWYLVRG